MVGRRRRRLRLAGRPAADRGLGRDGALRGACQGVHPAPPRRADRAAGHVRGSRASCCHDIPAGARRDERGAAADPCRDGRGPPDPVGAHELLGLLDHVVLRPGAVAGHGGRPAGRSPGRARRGQDDGPGAARRGPRGHPRRGLQPHGRGRGGRPLAVPAGAGQPRVLLDGPRHVPGRHRDRRDPGSAVGARHGSGARLASSLGAGGPCRRLPLRSGGDAGTGRSGLPRRPPAAAGDRHRPGAARGQAHRGALGRRDRWLADRRFPGPLRRVERRLPQRCPGLLALRSCASGEDRGRRRRRDPGSRDPPERIQRPADQEQIRPRCPRGAACALPGPRSTTSPRTMASPCGT